MLKRELLMKKEKSKVCFNPKCIYSTTRVFEASHMHDREIRCRNWIMDVEDFEKAKISDREHINFNFGGASFLENINSFLLLSTINWANYLETMKNQIICSFTHKISALFHKIQIKHQSMFSQEFIEEIKSLRKLIEHPNSNEEAERIVRDYIQPHAETIITFKYPEVNEISYLLNLPKGLEAKFCSQQFNSLNDFFSDSKEVEKIKQFLFEDISPYNKLQAVSSYCGKKLSNYDVSSGFVSLPCIFCCKPFSSKVQFSHSNALKQLKKKVALEVLEHIFTFHLGPLQEHILPRIEQPNDKKMIVKPEISYEDVVEGAKKYRKVRIADRETGIGYSEPEPTQFTFEVISKNNLNMARMRHIITKDRKISQILIYYTVIDLCFLRRIVDFDNLTIESNSCSKEKVRNLVQILKDSFQENEENEDDQSRQESSCLPNLNLPVVKSEKKREASVADTIKSKWCLVKIENDDFLL